MTDPGTERTISATRSAEGSEAVREISRGATLGRYVMLDRIGAGAMGVVYAAYDPELDRKLAIKVLHARQSTGGHRGLLREAQALAKLSHPNVVTVHDVGEHEGEVFVAMEYVQGRTLREWSGDARRPWPEIVDVFVRAGRGLQAAHETGLVHRDFKPDNVMLGDDGRVRVMDFGLAQARYGSSTREAADTIAAVAPDARVSVSMTFGGALVGTPAYMAPEQFGAASHVDAAADQFSFCVSLWEMLVGERPFRGKSLVDLASNVLAGRLVESPASGVPRWLRAAVRRGLAVDPAQRWPTMGALLTALEHGRRRARRRVGLVSLGAIATIAIGAVAWQHHDERARIAACETEGDRIADSWNETTRAGTRAALIGTGAKHASDTADRVVPVLDAYAIAWSSAATQACLDADVRGVKDQAELDRAHWCLEERRVAVETLVAEITRAEPEMVDRAMPAAASLPRIEPCTDAGYLARMPAPPTDRRAEIGVIRGAILHGAAIASLRAPEEALEILRGAIADAEAIGWPPLTAAARRALGGVLLSTGDEQAAEAELEAAYFEAAGAGASEVALEAAEGLAYALSHQASRPADALLWSRHAEVLLTSLPDPLHVRAATHAANAGAVHLALGAYDEAQTQWSESLRLAERAFGPRHLDTLGALGNLAVLYRRRGELASAKDACDRVLAGYEDSLGPHHPRVAGALHSVANVEHDLGNFETARTHLERALAIRQAAVTPEPAAVANIIELLGTIHTELGSNEEARRSFERVLAIRRDVLGPDHPHTGLSLLNLGATLQLLGLQDEAIASSREAVDVLERALGPEHPYVGAAVCNLGELYRQTEDREQARSLLERGVAITERAGGDPAALGKCVLQLADALLDQNALDQARSGYERAIDLLQNGPRPALAVDALVGMAELELKQGRHVEAVEASDRALRLGESIGTQDEAMKRARSVRERAGASMPQVVEAR